MLIAVGAARRDAGCHRVIMDQARAVRQGSPSMSRMGTVIVPKGVSFGLSRRGGGLADRRHGIVSAQAICPSKPSDVAMVR